MTAPCSGQLPAGHPALKAGVSEAIAGVLTNNSAREVGRWIGRKGDTASERGNDVDAWPLSELRAMADRDADLDTAVLAFWKGAAPAKGDGSRADGDALRVLPALLTEAQRMAAAVADGHVDQQEAREILRDLPALIADLRQMEQDLRAVAKKS